MNVENNCSLYIYCLTKVNYDYFRKSVHKKYITCRDNNNIKKNDIIILFCKDVSRPNCGFKALLKCSDNSKVNTNMDGNFIFKNGDMNKIIIKFNQIILFNKVIKIKDIISAVKTDNIQSLKNGTTFGHKFTKNACNPIKLDSTYEFQTKLINCFIKMNNGEEEQNTKKENKKKENTKKQNTKKENTEEQNTEEQISDEEKNTEEQNTEEQISDEGNEEQNTEEQISDERNEEQISDEGNEEQISDEETEEQIEETKAADDNNSLGFIPILIVPCDDFCFPKNNRDEETEEQISDEETEEQISDEGTEEQIKKYFIKHYKKCNKCIITNNNNRELCSIIDKATLDYVEINEEESGYLDPPLESYWALEKHEPIDANQLPFIRIAYINNGHDIYNKCILVTWQE